MMELVVAVVDAIRQITPDACMIVNNGLKIVGDSGLDAASPLVRQYLGSIQSVLPDDQFKNDSSPKQQHALTEAGSLFPDAAILSVETPQVGGRHLGVSRLGRAARLPALSGRQPHV